MHRDETSAQLARVDPRVRRVVELSPPRLRRPRPVPHAPCHAPLLSPLDGSPLHPPPCPSQAVAAHCGGWDKIDGGQCTHAWALLTGCKAQYTIRRNDVTGKYGCYGAYNPNESRYESLANSPHEGFQGLWPMAWPEVGGGGALGTEIDLEELFEKVGCDFLQGDHVRLGRLQGRELTAQPSRAVIFREPGVEGDEPKRTHLGAGL